MGGGPGTKALGVIPGRQQISDTGVSPAQSQFEPGSNTGEPRSITQGAIASIRNGEGNGYRRRLGGLAFSGAEVAYSSKSLR